MSELTPEFLPFAEKLAREVGPMIVEENDRLTVVRFKADGTSLTDTDTNINEYVIDTASRERPGIGIYGEEGISAKGDEAHMMVFDPLDGTTGAEHEMDVSTFAAGETDEKGMKSALVFDPFKNRMFRAERGKGAFCNDEPIWVNDIAPSRKGTVIISEADIAYHAAIKASGAELVPLAGACNRAMKLAMGMGRFCGIIQDNPSMFDVWPASRIVQEAGGRVTDFNDQPLGFPGKVEGVIFSNGETTHHELLEIVHSVRG
ncbi:MAG TPA: inositol monophosphatase family protein [Candidatus Saccharimonadia bacterium]|nr:inositol monophosphatase family protein [Candidatus Saccharimonadia bacterium]